METMPIYKDRFDSALSLESWRHGDEEILRPSGVLDHAASLDLRLALSQRLDAGQVNLTVDLSRLRLLDCAAADTLLRAQLEAQERGGGLRTPGASDLVLDVLEIIGAAKRLRAYDDPPSALHRRYRTSPSRRASGRPSTSCCARQPRWTSRTPGVVRCGSGRSNTACPWPTGWPAGSTGWASRRRTSARSPRWG